jgi:hypothetical protein
MTAVRPPAPDASIDLTSYIVNETNSERLFSCRDLKRASAPVQHCDRRHSPLRREEGALRGLTVDDLTRYLSHDQDTPAPQTMVWPTRKSGRGVGFFLYFDPPWPELPDRIQGDRAMVFRSTCSLHNAYGFHVTDGAAVRTVRFEGFESIETQSAIYDDCVRLSIVSDFAFPWGSRATLTEYVWLARGVGEVSRIQHIAGTFLFLRFESTYLQELITQRQTEPMQTASATSSRLRPWRCCAIYLDRFLPRPRLGGVVIDYAAPQASRTTRDSAKGDNLPCEKQ